MKKNSALLLLLFIIPFRLLYGQISFSYDKISLERVTFYKPNEANDDGYIIVKKDNGNGSYTGSQWENGSTKPVAYVSGVKPRISAELKVECDVNTLYVKGDGPENFDPPSQKLVPSGSGSNIYSYPTIIISSEFELGKIRHWDPFEIVWFISTDEVNWVEVKQRSNNPLYVTRDTPEPPNIGIGYDHFHTLIKVSCEAADKEILASKIIDKIWSKIQTLTVEGADAKLNMNANQALKYPKSDSSSYSPKDVNDESFS